MSKIESDSFPANEDLKAAEKTGRLAYFLEFVAIVLLACLAAYAAST